MKTLSAPIAPVSHLGNLANALVTDTCPPKLIDIAPFQVAWNAAVTAGTAPPVNGSAPAPITTGVYDDATVAALYALTSTVPSCPSVDLQALAQDVATDSTICDGTSTPVVSKFMAAYAAWQTPGTTPAPVTVYSTTVAKAVEAVLGHGTAPFCSGGAAPGSGAGAGAGGSSGGTTPAATPASNTGLVIAGAVALAAVGGLFYMMLQGAGHAAAAGARLAAKPNPYDERTYKRALLDNITKGESAAVILRAQGHDADAERLERIVQANIREADARRWSVSADNAYARGQRAGERALRGHATHAAEGSGSSGKHTLPVALTFDGKGGFKPGRGNAGWTVYEFGSAEERAEFMARHRDARMPAWARIERGEA
jgi:hypothetical protein